MHEDVKDLSSFVYENHLAMKAVRIAFQWRLMSDEGLSR